MAFGSFGKGPAPAPAGGGISLGSSSFGAHAPSGGGTSFGTPAPAASTGNLFGSTTAPAPATGGALFGSTAAPAPAPAPGGLFGGTQTPAPAPAGGTFGTTPAPAAGGLFGTQTRTTTSFGSTPAPATTGGLFGSAPAPATGGFAGSTFGAAPSLGTLGGTTQPLAAAPVFSGQTPYASLPPEGKKAIDTIYEHIIRHRKTMIDVQGMAPDSLRSASLGKSHSSPADAAGGVPDPNSLPSQLKALGLKIEELKRDVDLRTEDIKSLRSKSEESVKQAIMYGKWPVEAISHRRGIQLKAPADNPTNPTVQDEFRKLLDQSAAKVDRVERVPSPYLWEILQDMETRLSKLQFSIGSLHGQIEQSRKMSQRDGMSVDDIARIVESHSYELVRLSRVISLIHEKMDQLRLRYRHSETGENVLDRARAQEAQRQRRVDEQILAQYVKAAPAGPSQAAPAQSSTGTFGSTSGMFGKPSTPAPSGFFGSSSTATTLGAAPSTAPAPGTNLFGASATPAPAPGGNLFGSSATPAPAPAGIFKAPAPAPAPGGNMFGSSLPTPQATPGAFGATTNSPAPAAFNFSSSTSSASTPRTRSKSRSGRSRR